MTNFCEERGGWKLRSYVGAARWRLVWLGFMVVGLTFGLAGLVRGDASGKPTFAPSLISYIAKAAARPPHSTNGVAPSIAITPIPELEERIYRDSDSQKSRSTSDNQAVRELQKIGVTLAKAVLAKNIETLLAYDREDLRAANAESLKNDKSDLYCYIFDSDCITWGDGTWRSVYEKISQAHAPEIHVQLISSRYDRQTYGTLFFYDGASVSAKDLRSRDFLCKEGPGKIASWKFRLEHGKWKAVTPLFDSETRAGCPDDAPEKE